MTKPKRQSVQLKFARLTAALEDLHELAVQGQASKLTLNQQRRLATKLEEGLQKAAKASGRITDVLKA